jgi:hypothetical protein
MIAQIILQTSNLNDSSLGCFANGSQGNATQCVIDGTFAAGPSPTLIGLLLAGTLLTSLHIAGDGTVVVPAVVTILFGSSLIALLPPQYVTLAYTVTVIGVTVAAFAAYQRFTTRGEF